MRQETEHLIFEVRPVPRTVVIWVKGPKGSPRANFCLFEEEARQLQGLLNLNFLVRQDAKK